MSSGGRADMQPSETPTDDRLAEIQQRADAATAGPWEYLEDEAIRQPGGQGVVLGPWTNDGSWCIEIGEEDAAFITHSREDIPWLLAELVSLRGQLEAATELHRNVRYDKYGNDVARSNQPIVSGFCSACGRFDGASCKTLLALGGAR